MRIYVNGRETRIDGRSTLAELVAGRGLDPAGVVVEHNLSVVPGERWPQVALSEGDEVEIISFVGGG